jgi:hypothetical protein
VHPDAGVEALGENDSISEGRAEPGGNREPILGIEAVLVETAEGHLGESFLSGRSGKKVGKENGPE